MSILNLSLLIIVIFATYSINKVVALQGENIRGGLPAERDHFRSQVAILGKKNYSTVSHLIGSGGIIAHDLILTAAQSFIHQNGSLREFTFFIVANEINLNRKPEILILIEEIYLPDDVDFLNKDLSVAKLAVSLNVHRKHLSALDLSDPGEMFLERNGIVAGYGFSSVRLNVSNTGRLYRLSGIAENKLKYANVRIIPEHQCQIWHRHFNNDTQICAILMTAQENQQWGLCEKDIGSPLVVINKIVGIASRNDIGCDDTVYGSIYSKVSAFAFFLFDIMEGNPASNTFIYANRQYIPPSYSCTREINKCFWKIAKNTIRIDQEEEKANQSEEEYFNIEVS